MGITYQVASATELSVALSNAQGDDIIELAAADYGAFKFDNVKSSSELIVRSADMEDPARFESVHVYKAEYLTIEGISVDLDVEKTEGYMVGVRIDNSANVTLKDSVLVGGFKENLENPELSDYPVGQAISMYRSSDIVIENNEASDFFGGILQFDIDGVTIKDNYVHHIRGTGIGGGDVQDGLITGNHVSGINPYKFGGSGDHADLIHYYPVPGEYDGMDNLTITDNFLEQGDSPQPVLGIYLDDLGSAARGLGYTNVTISNNIIHNGNVQGIRVENADGIEITNNTLLQSSGGTKDAPGIRLIMDTKNAVIDNNVIIGSFSGESFDDPALNIEIGDNLFVQRTYVDQDNYVGDLFVNGLTANGEIHDFTPIPGSAADGYGSTLAAFDATPDIPVGVISYEAHDGLGMKTLTLDVEAIFTSQGEIDPDTADITWDFGDGNTAKGATATNAFEIAGSHDITVTIASASGEDIVLKRTVDISDPFAIYANFESGAVDLSDDVTKVSVIGDVDFVETELGTSVRLGEGGSRVSFDGAPELLDNDEYSLSVAFKKDQYSRDGSLFYFSGTAYMSTTEDEVKFAGLTTTGKWIKLSYSGTSLSDDAWHQATVTYSQDLGEAVLYVDGAAVDSQSGVTGIQYTTDGHDLHLGNQSSNPFGGLLDEVQFIRAALDADEVASMYETLVASPAQASATTEADTTSLIEQVGTETATPSVKPLIVDVETPKVEIEAPVPEDVIILKPSAPAAPSVRVEHVLDFSRDVFILNDQNTVLNEKGWIATIYVNEEASDEVQIADLAETEVGQVLMDFF